MSYKLKHIKKYFELFVDKTRWYKVTQFKEFQNSLFQLFIMAIFSEEKVSDQGFPLKEWGPHRPFWQL